MKILHTADWQIGRQYDSFGPEDGPALAEARIAAVARLADLANEHAVAAVLVAGDVFDTQTVTDRTIRQLFNATAAYAGPWIMIPGNHDAALAESVWTRAARLKAIPANVHAALEPQVLLFEAAGFAVLPAPLTQRHTHDDLTVWFDTAETPAGLLRIGLAHGSVQGVLPDDIDSPNPIAADRAASARLDYLALGDWHGMKRIDARTWYSGTPEQDRFKDNEAGHALLVELSRAGEPPEVRPLRVGRFPWLQRDYVLHVASDVDRCIEDLEGFEPGCVLDLRIAGEIDLAGESRLLAALGRAEALHRSLRVDIGALRLIPTEEDLAALQADGYLGDVITELRGLQDGSEGEVAREALAMLTTLLRDRQNAEETS